MKTTNNSKNNNKAGKKVSAAINSKSNDKTIKKDSKHIEQERKIETVKRDNKVVNEKQIRVVRNKQRKIKTMNKQLLWVILGLFVIIAILIVTTILKKNIKEDEVITPNEVEKTENVEEIKEIKEIKEVSKINIVNTVSKTRPYAVSVNNTPVAVKVQEGLNKAYLVYEIPTEGNTSRLLALFKNQDDVTIGTIRSARHNFADYANESDAILICFGWSHYAENELWNGNIDFVNGNEKRWKSAFWRNNPEGLATEHTAYTSTKKIKNFISKDGYRLESKNADDTILLNYKEEEVNLDNIDGVKKANTITLPYGNIKTVFKYNSKTKEYTKYVNGKEIKDHKTKENITTKNIIVVKIGYKMASDNYYWDLKTTGSGDGFYITNGKYVKIKWEKPSRNARTKYTYLNGEEIEVNDGRTYIEVHTTKKKVTIN